MSTPTRKLIVTGATGKQGGALITALLKRSSQPFEIYAVTRNPSSPSAQKLADKPNVRVIGGDFDNADAIFEQVDKPWGLFSMSNFMKGVDVEERQGKAMTKAAIDAGVQHIVFTATERGGQVKSDSDPTNVPHFRSKYNIERDIISQSQSSSQNTTYTFLRPVAFMENIDSSFFGKAFTAMWRLNGLDRPLQLISTTDVGKVAAEAFLNPNESEFRNKAISLAGDEVTLNEATRIFKESTGKEIPSTFSFVGSALRWAVNDLGSMFRWFVTDGFGVDVKAVRDRFGLKDFGTWLREESAWKKV